MRLSHTQYDNVRESEIKTAPTQIMRNTQRKKQQRQRRRRQQQRKPKTNRQNIHTINNKVKSGGEKKVKYFSCLWQTLQQNDAHENGVCVYI